MAEGIESMSATFTDGLNESIWKGFCRGAELLLIPDSVRELTNGPHRISSGQFDGYLLARCPYTVYFFKDCDGTLIRIEFFVAHAGIGQDYPLMSKGEGVDPTEVGRNFRAVLTALLVALIPPPLPADF